MLGPESFVDVAGSVGLLGELFFAILREAVMRCQSWRCQGHAIGVSIDLPAPLLASRNLPRRMEDVVTVYGLDPAYISLEIDEQAWLQEEDLSREILTRLRLRGFRLAIDDFGSGFSSTKQLIDAPFNEMKIDRGCIHKAPTDREMAIALSSYVAVARQLDMTIAAEHVETFAHQEYVAKLGCDAMQGSLIAPPMSADEFEHWLEASDAPIAATTRRLP